MWRAVTLPVAGGTLGAMLVGIAFLFSGIAAPGVGARASIAHVAQAARSLPPGSARLSVVRQVLPTLRGDIPVWLTRAGGHHKHSSWL